MSYTLHLGDCRKQIGCLVNIDAIVTDPPYGLGKKLNGGGWGNVSEWDFLPDIAFLLELAPIVCVWGGNYHAFPASRGWLVWHKPDAPPSMANVELAWTNQDMNSRMISQTIAATNAERVGHPTQKPLRVMRWCLDTLGIPVGSTVADPFMGSGTTGVACQMSGRNFVGWEINPAFYALAERRISQAQMPMLFEVNA